MKSIIMSFTWYLERPRSSTFSHKDVFFKSIATLNAFIFLLVLSLLLSWLLQPVCWSCLCLLASVSLSLLLCESGHRVLSSFAPGAFAKHPSLSVLSRRVWQLSWKVTKIEMRRSMFSQTYPLSPKRHVSDDMSLRIAVFSGHGSCWDIVGYRVQEDYPGKRVQFHVVLQLQQPISPLLPFGPPHPIHHQKRFSVVYTCCLCKNHSLHILY